MTALAPCDERQDNAGDRRRGPAGFGAQPQLFRSNVIFLKAPLGAPEAMQSVSTKEGVDQAFAGEDVLYFAHLISRAGQSHLSRIAGLPIYKSLTIRNWNTTTKLVQMLGDSSR